MKAMKSGGVLALGGLAAVGAFLWSKKSAATSAAARAAMSTTPFELAPPKEAAPPKGTLVWRDVTEADERLGDNGVVRSEPWPGGVLPPLMDAAHAARKGLGVGDPPAYFDFGGRHFRVDVVQPEGRPFATIRVQTPVTATSSATSPAAVETSPGWRETPPVWHEPVAVFAPPGAHPIIHAAPGDRYRLTFKVTAQTLTVADVEAFKAQYVPMMALAGKDVESVVLLPENRIRAVVLFRVAATIGGDIPVGYMESAEKLN